MPTNPYFDWDRYSFGQQDDPYEFGQGLSGRQYKPPSNFDFGQDEAMSQLRQYQDPSARYGSPFEPQRAPRTQLTPPTFNMEPFNRYRDYLNQEPDPEKYKPGGFQRVLNSLAAGIEGYRTGSPAAGFKTGYQLNRAPYEDARQEWQQKGTRLREGADLEQRRFGAEATRYNQDVDNLRQQE